MIEIDGSTGEGGGQILRTSLALAMVTGQPVRFSRIRAGRPKPGLMRQHLTCVKAAQTVCGAEVQGAELGAQSLTFTPGAVHGGDYVFDIGSAGSCTLVLQTVWPALLLADAPSRLVLTGGTHNPLAPPFHFLQRSYAPLLARLGAPSVLQLHRLGFHPAGGGRIEAHITPATQGLQPFDLLERGARQGVYAECFAPALARAVAHRELTTLQALLGWSFEADQLRLGECRQNEGPGNALLATLAFEHVTEVFTEFGSKRVSAEQVAKRLARSVRAYLAQEAALGKWLADQWALPLALAVWQQSQCPGFADNAGVARAAYTCTHLSAHAHTNFATIAQFLTVHFATQRSGAGWRVDVAAGYKTAHASHAR